MGVSTSGAVAGLLSGPRGPAGQVRGIRRRAPCRRCPPPLPTRCFWTRNPPPPQPQKWLKNQRSQVWAAVWPSRTSPSAVLGSGRGSLSARVRKLTRTEESLKYAENQSCPAAVANGSFEFQLKQTQPISRVTRPAGTTARHLASMHQISFCRGGSPQQPSSGQSNACSVVRLQL